MNTKNMIVPFIIIATFLLASSASSALAQAFAVTVVPSKNSIQLDEEVTVNVTVSNVPDPGLYSYELKLYYNKTLLNGTKAEAPDDHFLKPSLASGNIFWVDTGTINQSLGFVSFAVTLLGAEEGKTGSGTLVTVTFKGLAVGDSVLQLPSADLILVDGGTTPKEMTGYSNNPATVQVVPEFAVIAMMAILVAMSGAAVMLKKKLK